MATDTKPLEDWESARFTTAGVVADLFGTSPATIHNHMQTGEIPFVRIGKLKRIPTAWVKAKLAEADDVAA